MANGVVYVGSTHPNPSLWAFDAGTGALLWTYPLGTYYASPVVANGVLVYSAPITFNDHSGVYSFHLPGK